MLFLACGLFLITVVPMALSIGVISLGQAIGFHPRVYTFHLPIVSRVSQSIGLCTLLYSLLIIPSDLGKCEVRTSTYRIRGILFVPRSKKINRVTNYG